MLSRLIMPLVMILLLRPLYLSALARRGVQAGTVQVVTGMLVMFSLLALSVVGTAILTERTWGTWDRLRATSGAERRTARHQGAARLRHAGRPAGRGAALRRGRVRPARRRPDPAGRRRHLVGAGPARHRHGAGRDAAQPERAEHGLRHRRRGAQRPRGRTRPAVGAARVGPGRRAGLPGLLGHVRPPRGVAGQAGPALRAMAVLLAVAAVTAALGAWRITRGWARSTQL